MDDIRYAGVLAGFVRWGNPNHGLLDGALLDDGGAGATFPDLRPYRQSADLWVTPALRIEVPGYVPPELPVAAPGATWLGYGIMAGLRRTLYQKELFFLTDTHFQWMASFGEGDTWRCSASTPTVTAGSGTGDGTASVSVTFHRFGDLQQVDPVIETFILTSNTITAGQPVFSGTTDDFASSSMKLVPIDFSEDGTDVIIAVMPVVADYFGFSAPRGLMRLQLTKTTATLTLLKSRSDMLVSVVEASSGSTAGGISEADFTCTVPRTLNVPAYDSSSIKSVTATHIVGAYFKADGVLDYLHSEVVTVDSIVQHYDSWTQECSSCVSGDLGGCTVTDGQSIGSTVTGSTTESVTISRLSDAGVIVAASASYITSSIGTHASSGGSWTNNASRTITVSQTSISGSVQESVSAADSTPTTTSLPEHPTFEILAYHAYPYHSRGSDGSFTRAPYEFDNVSSVSPVSLVGSGGMLCHFSAAFLEYSVFSAQHATAGEVTTGGDRAIVSVHPKTGEVATKTGTWSETGAPSFGWV